MKNAIGGCLVALTLASTLAYADKPSSAEQRAVEAAIAAKSRAFEQCYAKGDAKCVVNDYYVSDAHEPVAFPPGGAPPVKGRAALMEMFQKEFQGAERIRLETLQVVVDGSMAQEVGRAHLSLRTGATAVGRYVVLWIREADGWRAKVDFIAADGSPPTAG